MSLIGKKYVVALFDVALEKNNLDEVYDEFTSFSEILKREKKFFDLLMTPSIEKKKKKVILNHIFGTEMNTYLKNLLYILLDKNRFDFIGDIYQDFRKTYFDNKNMVEALVLTVHPIDDHLQAALKEKLEKRFEKKVKLKNQTDPSILGGVVVYVGEQVIDGSVRKQLSEIKEKMNNIRLH